MKAAGASQGGWWSGRHVNIYILLILPFLCLDFDIDVLVFLRDMCYLITVMTLC